MKKYITPHKIFYHPERLYNVIEGNAIFPVCLDVHLTNKCNNACFYCGAQNKNGVSMNFETLKKTIKFAVDNKIKSIVFTGGGEPTVSEYFVDAVKIAYSAGIDIGVITNGVKFDYNLTSAVMRYCTWIRVSLDAGDTETYKTIRGTNHFDKVIENINILCNFKHLTKCNTTIGAQIVVNRYNLEIVSLYKQLIKLIPRVNYINIRPIEATQYNKPYSDEEIKIIKQQIASLPNDDRLILSDKWNNQNFGFSTCYAANAVNVVDPSGDIYLCCHHIGDEKYKFCNVHDDEFIKFKQFVLNNLDNMGFDPDHCPVGCRGSQTNIAVTTMLNEPHKNFI